MSICKGSGKRTKVDGTIARRKGMLITGLCPVCRKWLVLTDFAIEKIGPFFVRKGTTPEHKR